VLGIIRVDLATLGLVPDVPSAPAEQASVPSPEATPPPPRLTPAPPTAPIRPAATAPERTAVPPAPAAPEAPQPDPPAPNPDPPAPDPDPGQDSNNKEEPGSDPGGCGSVVDPSEPPESVNAEWQVAVAQAEAGADMIFPEAVTELAQYRKFVDAVKVPVLANITEFGQTPLFTLAELRSAGVAIALYPLSAFRAMNKAALAVYAAVRQQGTQKDVVASMQTRDELYDYLDYHAYEKKLDELFARS